MADRHVEIVCLIPHPTRAEVLTRPDGTLPRTGLDGEYRMPAVLEAIGQLIGPVPPLLRADQRGVDADHEPTLVGVDLETCGATAPTGFRWTDRAAAGVGAGATPEVRAALAGWIARRERGPTTLDPPWTVPGWMARASAWMEEQLRAAGRPATARPRLVYSWGISVVLCAPTTAGDHFLECSAPIFHAEPAITALLASATPDLVTQVVATEPDEGWLLMGDNGGRPLGEEPESTWASGLQTLATLQHVWRDRTDELVAAGAPMRSITELADQLPTLADRDPLRRDLAPAMRAAWDDALPRFVAACHRFVALGPAPTLVHGDFHPWNAAWTGDRPLLFDWSDGAVSHPFTDLAVYLTRTRDKARRREMLETYLAHWADDGIPAAELEEAAHLAFVVGSLYQVAVYDRLLTSLEPEDRGGMDGATGSWAGGAIDALERGIETERPGHADG
jgi:hypothetical protein